jgi:hypothetical protein
MPDKVLYFPYIRVPASTWFTRILLYWDEVGTLVPYNLIEAPEQLGKYTRGLIENQLVTQVIPGMYVHRIPRFTEAFLDYLNGLGNVVDQRRSSFENGEVFPIYTEKIGTLDRELERLRLARPNENSHSLVNVERQTGLEFMLYLATALGRLPDLQFVPVTDEDGILAELASNGASTAVKDLDRLRLEILEEVLPVPSEPIDASDIRGFKTAHGQQLKRFRRHIEMEITVIAGLHDQEMRMRRLQLFKDQAQAEIADIRDKMVGRGWIGVTVERLCALLEPIPGSGPWPALIKAAMSAFYEDKPNLESPLAYAAFVERKFLAS